MHEWYIYMIRCADNSLYTGVTTDVERRFCEHSSGGPKAARYVRGRGPLELVFFAPAGTRSDALRLELRVKALGHADKERIIQGQLALPCRDIEACTGDG